MLFLILFILEVETGLEPVGTNDVNNHNNSTYRISFLGKGELNPKQIS